MNSVILGTRTEWRRLDLLGEAQNEFPKSPGDHSIVGWYSGALSQLESERVCVYCKCISVCVCASYIKGFLVV